MFVVGHPTRETTIKEDIVYPPIHLRRCYGRDQEVFRPIVAVEGDSGWEALETGVVRGGQS